MSNIHILPEKMYIIYIYPEKVSHVIFLYFFLLVEKKAENMEKGKIFFLIRIILRREYFVQ